MDPVVTAADMFKREKKKEKERKKENHEHLYRCMDCTIFLSELSDSSFYDSEQKLN